VLTRDHEQRVGGRQDRMGGGHGGTDRFNGVDACTGFGIAARKRAAHIIGLVLEVFETGTGGKRFWRTHEKPPFGCARLSTSPERKEVQFGCAINCAGGFSPFRGPAAACRPW